MKKLLSKKKEKQILKALSYNISPAEIAPYIGFTKRFVYLWIQRNKQNVKIARNRYKALLDGIFSE